MSFCLFLPSPTQKHSQGALPPIARNTSFPNWVVKLFFKKKKAVLAWGKKICPLSPTQTVLRRKGLVDGSREDLFVFHYSWKS